jgi:hypothetical protein
MIFIPRERSTYEKNETGICGRRTGAAKKRAEARFFYAPGEDESKNLS